MSSGPSTPGTLSNTSSVKAESFARLRQRARQSMKSGYETGQASPLSSLLTDVTRTKLAESVKGRGRNNTARTRLSTEAETLIPRVSVPRASRVETGLLSHRRRARRASFHMISAPNERHRSALKHTKKVRRRSGAHPRSDDPLSDLRQRQTSRAG